MKHWKDFSIRWTSESKEWYRSSIEILFRYDDAKTSEHQTIFENYQSIRWTPLTTEILETFYELAPIHLSCNGSNGNYIPKFDWRREYRPDEPEQRDVPLEQVAKCNWWCRWTLIFTYNLLDRLSPLSHILLEIK